MIKRIINGIYMRFLTKYWYFYRMYLEMNYYKRKKWLASRKGKCNKCGSCCDCSIKKDNLCGDRELSKMIGCYRFPIHPLDLKVLRLETKCGYYWEKK